jgi:hypothetical protein
MIKSLGLISKENTPLYTYNRSLKYDFMTHCCIDIMDKSDRKYMGLLYCMEDTSCFGYITNTGIKMVLMLETQDGTVRDATIQKWFAKAHDVVVRSLLNPFYEPGQRMISPVFEKRVEELVQGGLV